MAGSYNAGSIEASLKLDRSEFNRELGQAKRDAEEFGRQSYTPKVSLDDAEAKAKIAALKQDLQSLHNVSLSAALSGYDAAAAQLSALKAQVDALNNTPVVIHVDADTRSAAASLAALRTAAQEPITIQADIDTRTAAASLAALRQAANDPLTAPLVPGEPGDSGTPSPGAPARPVPTPGDDEDGNRRRTLRAPSFAFLQPLIGLPGLIASVLPQIPALTTAVGGLTAAVGSFGVAAAGSLGLYGVATMGAVKQSLAHKKALEQANMQLNTAQQVLSKTTAGTQQYELALANVTKAEEKQKAALEALTPAEKTFIESQDKMKTAWQDFIGATEQYTLKPVVTVMDGLRGALPKLIPLIKDMAPVVQDVATGLAGWMNGGGLERFVTFLRTNGVPIVKNMIAGLKGFLTAGGSLVRAFGPIAVRMSGWFKELGERADAWGKNGGAERFRVRFTQSWHQLQPIFAGLLGLMKHVWDMLSGTGQPNADALANVISGIATAVGNIQPAAVKAFGEIFQSLSDVAVALAPVIGVTSQAIVLIIDALPPGLIRAIADAMIAWKLAVLGWNAAIAVWAFLTTVVNGLRVAWATLNLVWYASPVGVIVALGLIIIGVIVLIATKTTWFQQLWKLVWGGIKDAALWTWNTILHPVFNGIVDALKTVGKWGQWLWTHALKPAWDGISGAAIWLWNTVLHPIFSGMMSVFETVGKWIWKIWTTYLKVVFILFAAAVKAAWVFVIKPVFGWLKEGWDLLAKGIKWAWEHWLKPVWDGVGAAVSYMWKHWVKPAFDNIKLAWTVLAIGLKYDWNHYIKPVWEAIADKATSLWKNYIKPAWDGISGSISDAWTGIKKYVFSPMGTFFTKTIPGWGETMKTKLVGFFDEAWKGIQVVWDNVKKAIGSPIYLVAKYVWNDGLYSIMDKIAGFVHQKNPLGKINTDKIPHFAAGGPVPHTSRSTPGKDSVTAMLMPDEHVFTREDVAAMGGHQAVLRFRSALHGGARVQGANSTGAFGLGGWVDDVGGALKGAASKTVDSLKDAVLGTVGIVVNPLLDKAVKTVDKFVPTDSGWNVLANSALKTPIDWIKKYVEKEDSKGSSVGGTIPTGQHLAIIDAALKAAGVPPPGSKEQWEAGLNTLIQRESGWNPKAINNWDSNAKAGHPSQGLAQTIPSTFNAYVPASLRSRGILDPIANVAAAIRYIVSVYGGIQNVQQANSGKNPKGYWTGTPGAAPGLAWVGEKGPELINFHGGETVYNNADSMRIASALGSLHGYARGTVSQRARVRDAFEERDSDIARRDAAQKKYNTAHDRYLNATTKAAQQAAKKEMEKYQKQVDKANREIANDTKLIKLNEKRYKTASKAVEEERKDADTLEKARKRARDTQIKRAREQLQDRINKMKERVDAQLQTATDARNSYYDNALQTGQLSTLSGNRATGFAQQLKDKIKAIKDFQANLHTLATLGLSKALIQQIAAMGPEQGGQLAQSLARTTTKMQVADLNKQYSELEKASAQYADSAADDGYDYTKLKRQSDILSKTKITVTAPRTIIVNMDGKSFRAYTEKIAEHQITDIVNKAGKKK